jgi:hypothetical protein
MPKLPRGEEFDFRARARTLNQRWLVRGELDRDADDYMRHLESIDPRRLDQSCKNAWRMTELREDTEDPKPWFYAGLFSLATEAETEQFLARHWLTRAAVSAEAKPRDEKVSAATAEKLRRLRDALGSLPG